MPTHDSLTASDFDSFLNSGFDSFDNRRAAKIMILQDEANLLLTNHVALIADPIRSLITEIRSTGRAVELWLIIVARSRHTVPTPEHAGPFWSRSIPPNTPTQTYLEQETAFKLGWIPRNFGGILQVHHFDDITDFFDVDHAPLEFSPGDETWLSIDDSNSMNLDDVQPEADTWMAKIEATTGIPVQHRDFVLSGYKDEDWPREFRFGWDRIKDEV